MAATTETIVKTVDPDFDDVEMSWDAQNTYLTLKQEGREMYLSVDMLRALAERADSLVSTTEH